MFCPKCGNQLPDQAVFCQYCGRQLGNNSNQRKKTKFTKKKGTKLRVALLCTSVILIGIAGTGGYFFYQYYNSPEQIVLRDLASGNFVEAARVYNRNYDERDNVPEDVLSTATKALNDSYIAFVNGEKNYSAVFNDIESIAKMHVTELEEKLADTQASVDALNASRTAFEMGNQYLDDAKYKEAIQEYQKVIADDGNYDTAQEKMNLATDSYCRSVLEDAKAKADAGNLSGAVTVLESGLKVLENNSQITRQLTQYQDQIAENSKQDALESAKSDANNGNYKSALQTLKSALASQPDDSDLQTLYDKYEAAYVKDVVAAADELIGQNDYDSAIVKLTEASSFLKDNQELADKLAETKDEKPVKLYEIKMSNSEGMSLEDDAMEDIVGNVYSGNNLFSLNCHNSINNYGEFYLGEQYAILSGVIVPESGFGQNSAVNIEIYADNELKYSLKVVQKTLATSFDVNISGCQWLKIVASPIDGDYNKWSTQTLLYNPVLKRNE